MHTELNSILHMESLHVHVLCKNNIMLIEVHTCMTQQNCTISDSLPIFAPTAFVYIFFSDFVQMSLKFQKKNLPQ